MWIKNIKTKIMEQKKLVGKIIKKANKIQMRGNPKAKYIHVLKEFVQHEADERGISFDEMAEIFRTVMNPKK